MEPDKLTKGYPIKTLHYFCAYNINHWNLKEGSHSFLYDGILTISQWLGESVGKSREYS